MYISKATIVAISVAGVSVTVIIVFAVGMKISRRREIRDGVHRRNSNNGHSVTDPDWEAAIPLPTRSARINESRIGGPPFYLPGRASNNIGATIIHAPRRAQIQGQTTLGASTTTPSPRNRSRAHPKMETSATPPSPNNEIQGRPNLAGSTMIPSPRQARARFNMEATTTNRVPFFAIQGQAPAEPEDDHPSAADWQGLVYRHDGQRMIKRTQTVFAQGATLTSSHYEWLPPTAASLRIAGLPPLPAAITPREEGDLGTQAPPAALYARRSDEGLEANSSASSLPSYLGNAHSQISSRTSEQSIRPLLPVPQPAVIQSPDIESPASSRGRFRYVPTPTTPARVRRYYQATGMIPTDPVALEILRTNTLAAAAEKKAARDAARNTKPEADMTPSKQMASTGNNGEYTNAEFEEYKAKVMSANSEFARTPTRPEPVAKPTEQYDVKHGLLSATPVLKRATSPSSPGVPISPLTAIKSSANRLSAIKERVFGDEHHEKLKAMISGPIPYAPNLDRSCSVRSYGARHGTSPIASPKIDHPKKFEEQVFKEDSSGSEENDIATAMSKMDEQTG